MEEARQHSVVTDRFYSFWGGFVFVGIALVFGYHIWIGLLAALIAAALIPWKGW
jgi:hypothetical protein